MRASDQSQRVENYHRSLRQIAIALRDTTEVIARELVSSSSEPPAWTKFEWLIAQSAVSMHGVASLLQAKLRWTGPLTWQEFLYTQKQQTAARYAKIAHLLNAIEQRARNANLSLIALKGAALHERKIYAAGERPMADVDLLVHANDCGPVAKLLADCNYVPSCNIRRHQIFVPRGTKTLTQTIAGEHIDVPIKVEVHKRICEHLPAFETDITQELFPRVARAGLNSYPSDIALMMHLLLHAAGNIRARALRLIQLNDIALVAQSFSGPSWSALLAIRLQGHGLWWALPPLAITEKYFPGSIPSEVLASFRSLCPWLLGKRARNYSLTEVSWSNMRIEAFPGLEWSRTLREAAQFLASRIAPGESARSELDAGAAAIPGSATIGWYESSHRARILRWIFSRPPRVQTLLSVRAVIGEGEGRAANGITSK